MIDRWVATSLMHSILGRLYVKTHNASPDRSLCKKPFALRCACTGKRIKGGIQLEFMSICSSHWVLNKYIHEQEEWLFKNKVVRLISTGRWSGRLHWRLQGGIQLEFQEYLFQSLSTKYEMNLHTITRPSSKQEIPFLFGGLKGGLGSRSNPMDQPKDKVCRSSVCLL